MSVSCIAPGVPAPRPEQGLLLCCARARLGPGDRERLRDLLREGPCWGRLRALADYHGLAPLLYRHLAADGAGLCPEGVLRPWRDAAVAVLAANMRSCAELVALVRLFRREGIGVAAFKGPVAAAAYYGHLGARTFVDLDVLVPAAQAREACAALARAGYAPHFPLRPGWDEVYLRRNCERVFDRAGPAATVDLHWGLLPPGYSFTPLAGEVWGRLESVRLGGADVPTLGPEDTLLFLCLHAAKHEWASLHWLCDVAEFLRTRPGVDWDWVRATAERGGAWRLVRVGLLLARGLLEAPVPAAALRGGRGAEALAGEAARSLLSGAERRGPRWPWRSLYYRARERRRDRARLVHDLILAPSVHEWGLVPLPPALAPLYYAVRPFRLLLKGALSETRAFRGREAPPRRVAHRPHDLSGPGN
jgi:hypothetical protein